MPVIKKAGKVVKLPYTQKGMKMAETMKKNMGTVRNNLGTMKNTMKKAMPRGK